METFHHTFRCRPPVESIDVSCVCNTLALMSDKLYQRIQCRDLKKYLLEDLEVSNSTFTSSNNWDLIDWCVTVSKIVISLPFSLVSEPPEDAVECLLTSIFGKCHPLTFFFIGFVYVLWFTNSSQTDSLLSTLYQSSSCLLLYKILAHQSVNHSRNRSVFITKKKTSHPGFNNVVYWLGMIEMIVDRWFDPSSMIWCTIVFQWHNSLIA